MLVYRLCNPEFADDLSGEGAFLYGGRWNFKGERMLYTATNASLSLLETLGHLSDFPSRMPLSLLTIEIELEGIFQPLVSEFPPNWNEYPAPTQIRSMGSDFLQKAEFPAMLVPSVLMPKDLNLLIHPGHRGIRNIKIRSQEEFSPQKRILSKVQGI